jgi:nitroreductase
MAATARNVQPWEFVVVTDAVMRRRIALESVTGPFIADAPVCVVVLCQDTKYYLEDGCAATQNLLVAARAHGLGACWVAGDKKPCADTVPAMVGAPEGYRLVSLVAFGYSDAEPSAKKRPLGEVLHWERF